MRLKDYQREALEVFGEYLSRLGTAMHQHSERLRAVGRPGLPDDIREMLSKAARTADPLGDAWKGVPDLPQRATALAPWTPVATETGRSVPSICLKVPTGGGKTLMAAYAVEQLQIDWLRRQTGVVLWIVPSQAIYAQTLAALKDRTHPIRQVLDRASAAKTKILEKGDRFTRADADGRLCVMLLMLQSARREDEKVLRMFRGDGDASFFPDETDMPAIQRAVDAVSNLDRYDLAQGSAMPGSIKRTLANVLRLVEPVVVVDEAHNAVTELGRKTLAKLNPKFILELTATPTEHSNVLVDVKGKALRDEEMIKLPINVAVDVRGNWKGTLQAALDKLDELEAAAQAHRAQSGDYIRPILLVRVDFTGEKQRDREIHVEDAVEWLVQTGGLDPERHIRRQTAEKKELGDEDLMSERSEVRVVVTRDALREGWDCPFAYVLAILSPSKGRTGLTQFIGRVLRQPYARLTGHASNGTSLDQCYVFCREQGVAQAVDKINAGLMGEGMGDLQSAVRASEIGDGRDKPARIAITRAEKFRARRILLPRVLHADPAMAGGWRDLDYEADILSAIPWDRVSWTGAGTYVLTDDRARRFGAVIDLDAEGQPRQVPLAAALEGGPAPAIDRVDLIRRLTAAIPNPWQGERILDETLAELHRRGASDDDIAAGRQDLAAAMTRDLLETVEAEAEAAFRGKLAAGTIVFRLTEPALDLTLAEANAGPPLYRADAKPPLKALYMPVLQSEVNGFERDVALYLDDHDAVGWWWRVAARRDRVGLQGWRPHKVYPDFLVALDEDGRSGTLLALETKGKFLNNPDTQFKRTLFETLAGAYAGGKPAGQLELGQSGADRIAFEILLGDGTDAWRSDLARTLGTPALGQRQ